MALKSVLKELMILLVRVSMSICWGVLGLVISGVCACVLVCSQEAFVFLVNGWPIQDINIHIWDQARGSSYPFLFLLVVNGLLGRWFDYAVSLLVDDTLILEDAIVENQWVIKSILWGFELASEHWLNLSKSNIIGVCVTPNFWTMVKVVLLYKHNLLSFKYLSLPVGMNHS